MIEEKEIMDGQKLRLALWLPKCAIPADNRDTSRRVCQSSCDSQDECVSTAEQEHNTCNRLSPKFFIVDTILVNTTYLYQTCFVKHLETSLIIAENIRDFPTVINQTHTTAPDNILQ